MTTQGPITIYNRRLGQDRRDVYIPTRISAASYAEKMGSSHSDGATSEALTYKLRIPAYVQTTGGRPFVREAVYKNVDEATSRKYWTLQKLDLIVLGEPVLGLVDATEKEIRAAALTLNRNVIIVEEYADNTGRGSPAVRHWRIGGR